MEYIDQVQNISMVVITRPRIYLKWEDTEEGRDKKQHYERVVDCYNSVHYVNQYNKSMITGPNDDFFKILEEIYLTSTQQDAC